MNTDNRGSVKFNYSDSNRVTLSFIQYGSVNVPFREKSGPSLYIKDGLITKPVVISKKDGLFANNENGISFSLKHNVRGGFLI